MSRFARGAGRLAYHGGVVAIKHLAVSAAKRFVTVLALPTAPLSALDTNTVITVIPRSLGSTSISTDDRLNRKINISGVSVRLAFQNVSILPLNYQRFRVIVYRALKTQDLIMPPFDVPVGVTRGVLVLMDKQYLLQSNAATNGRSALLINKFVKVGKECSYDGTATDGTDTDEGTIRVLILLDGPSSDTEYHGCYTVHFKDLAN